LSLQAYLVRAALLTILLAIAVFSDLRRRRIPNTLTFSAVGLGITWAGWFEGQPGLSFAVCGLAVGLFVFLPFYLLGACGAGDVKLMAAAGTYLGPQGALLAVALSLIAGAVVGGFIALRDRKGGSAALAQDAVNFSSDTETLASSAQNLPYAPAIAVGCMTTLMWMVA
jgi:prepilin peptidase CpaA